MMAQCVAVEMSFLISNNAQETVVKIETLLSVTYSVTYSVNVDNFISFLGLSMHF